MLQKLDSDYKGDAFFPDFIQKEWKEVAREGFNFREVI